MIAVPGEGFDWACVDCVVFDMDGTLLDLHFDDLVWNHSLPRSYGVRTGVDEVAARALIRRELEQARGTLAYYCLDHWSATFGIDLHDVEMRLAEHVRVRPGVVDFLAWLTARGLRLVLATNAHPRSLARKLELTAIGRHFEYIVSAHEFGHPKEHAAFWSALCARCALDPQRTLFIDDNPAVLAAAQRFGIQHLYGIAHPDSHREAVQLDDFHCLCAFDELTTAAVRHPGQGPVTQ